MSFKNIAKLVKQASQKEVTPAEQFQQFLERSIIIDDRNNSRPPSQTYKPSSLGGCLRKVYFEVTGAPIDEATAADPSFVGICESGTDRHERLQQHVINMKKYGIDCNWVPVQKYLELNPQLGTEIVEQKGNETKLRNTVLNLSFMCDGIISFGGKYYILEIKTEVSFKFDKRQEVDEQHLIQATTYSAGLGISDVIFLYEQRDMCKKKYMHVHVTEEEVEERILSRIEQVESHRIDGTVPPKTDKKSQCSYCDFVKECKKR